MKRYISVVVLLFVCLVAFGQVQVKRSGGWLETAFVEWELYTGADMYNVYYKVSSSSQWTKIDKELVRNYGYYGRADVVGISAGVYDIKIVATNGGAEIAESATTVKNIGVEAHDRAGFAFMNGVVPGAYKSDGTLKDGAKVFYVNNSNFNTITWEINKDAKGTKQTCVGVQGILAESVLKAMKYNDNAPICIRIIGEINTTGFPSTSWGSSAEGLSIKGDEKVAMNITIEGVGEDACVNGFGIFCRSSNSVELRNLGVMNVKDDDVSLDTDNYYTWVHNLDLYYGNAGSDSDQAKGDGTVDVKGDSKYQTYSYNHFWDSGKCSLCGMKSESGPNYITYHHNWFDHSDSRHPRVRTMTVHVYNNYYDGVAKYGVGATSGSNVFVEANYFRNTNRPMMSSKQGTDATGDGTFSGEDGGMIKAYGNQYVECGKNFSYITANDVDESAATGVSKTSFDAYEASSRNEQVPATYKTLQGGKAYSNFDTDASVMPSYKADKAVEVPAKVKRYAGRMNGGDIVFVFNNAVDDASSAVNTELKSMIKNYKSSLVAVASFSKTSSKPKTYKITFLNEDGSEFAVVEDLVKVVYPEENPTSEDPTMTFIGWNVARGTVLSSDIEVQPMFSDGSNTEGEGVGGVEVINEWAFTSWSTASKNITTTQTDTWLKNSDNTLRYFNKNALSKSGLGLEETEGLLFTCNSSKLLVSYDSSKGSYIQTIATIYVPASAGEQITISFSNTGNNGARYIRVNGVDIAGSSSTAKVVATINVTEAMVEDGYVAITCSGNLNFFSIKRTFDVSTLEKPKFKFAESYKEVDIADNATWEYPSLTNTSDNTTVEYSSSDETIASVGADGAVALKKMGTAVITAKIARTDTYRAATARYTLKVKDSSIPSYTVTYKVGEETYAVLTEQYTVVYPDDMPEKEGFTFEGWSVPEGDILTHDTTIEATFAIIPVYTVKFLNADGTVYEQMDGQKSVAYPSGKPVKSGYTFKGWSVKEGTVLTADIDVTPVFEENATDTDSGIKPEEQYEIVLYTQNSNKAFYTAGGFFNMNSTAVKNSSDFGPFVYEGITYKYGVKINKSGKVNFTLTKAMKMVVVFNAEKPVKVDGVASSKPVAIEGYTGLYKLEVDLAVGAHELTYNASETQFFLLYLETISSATPIETVEGDKEVMQVEYYGLNGEKKEKAGRGVNIEKTVYTDGRVEVRRVLKK
ncbi:MAG: InlB B-repeat-containing protein [Bacteroidales bacterium]|nr:InlB B-repeat-containing protein [Bacteroidales bacterium]